MSRFRVLLIKKVLKGGQRACLRRKRKLFALKKGQPNGNENNQVKDSPLSLFVACLLLVCWEALTLTS